MIINRNKKGDVIDLTKVTLPKNLSKQILEVIKWAT